LLFHGIKTNYIGAKIPLIPPLKSGHKSNLYHGIKRFFGFYAMALFSRVYGTFLFLKYSKFTFRTGT
jgi:hypothetical protein